MGPLLGPQWRAKINCWIASIYQTNQIGCRAWINFDMCGLYTNNDEVETLCSKITWSIDPLKLLYPCLQHHRLYFHAGTDVLNTVNCSVDPLSAHGNSSQCSSGSTAERSKSTCPTPSLNLTMNTRWYPVLPRFNPWCNGGEYIQAEYLLPTDQACRILSSFLSHDNWQLNSTTYDIFNLIVLRLHNFTIYVLLPYLTHQSVILFDTTPKLHQLHHVRSYEQRGRTS